MYNKVRAIVDPVYLVGGCVRDKLLGLTPKDYDFATPLTPDEIEAAIRKAGRRPYLVGKRFGTIGVKIDGVMVEITTFRSEQYDPDNRKPRVAFVKDITADLSRRDFTINAIAKRGSRIIDPFEGHLDLEDKIIRCVGEPKHRFDEDPLRMLRAGRFASQLGFVVDEPTKRATLNMSYKILHVSKERWMMELDKLLVCANPSVGLNFLMHTRLMNYMIPELALQFHFDQDSPYHDLTLWDHTLLVVDACPADVNLRWAALVHDIAKPFVKARNDKGYSNYIRHDYLGYDMVKRLGTHLKWSKDRLKVVSELVRDHLLESNPLKPYDDAAKRHIAI